MKKIPTLFERVFDDHGNIVDVKDTITPGCKEAFLYGTATVKIDGACCAIYHGDLYRRFDAKPGRKIPAGAIPCQPDPDPVTGHFPHWVKCDRNDPSDQWYFSAWGNTVEIGHMPSVDPEKWTTFEAVGKHFNANPYGYFNDYLLKHGSIIIKDIPRVFNGVREFLSTHYIEGVVFWYGGEPVCKIKRTDFGFEWGIQNQKYRFRF